MIFHQPQKTIRIPEILIDNVPIQYMESFNLLASYLDEHMSWKYHTNNISNKISRSVGILNRLENILPTYIKLMIYNALILSRINYGILLWGYNSERLFNLQNFLKLPYICYIFDYVFNCIDFWLLFVIFS